MPRNKHVHIHDSSRAWIFKGAWENLLRDGCLIKIQLLPAFGIT